MVPGACGILLGEMSNHRDPVGRHGVKNQPSRMHAPASSRSRRRPHYFVLAKLVHYFISKVTTMGIIDDIKSSSIEELHLSNMPEDYFGTSEEFASAMKVNTSIKTVIFDNDFLACSKGDDRALIVSSLATLPNLEKVVLKDSFLMIGICITNLTKNSKKLNDLSMVNCTLQGVPADFDKLVNALKENENIKKLQITNCNAPHADVDLGKVMADLKDGLTIEISGEGH